MYNKNATNINYGDSVEANIYNFICKGFILNHFITSKIVGSDDIRVLYWLLINDKNELICVSPKNVIKTSRIVLTEKTKCPTKINEEFFSRAMESERDFKNRQFIYKSRQSGKTNAFFQQMVYQTLANKEPSDLTTLPQVKITFLAGKSE